MRTKTTILVGDLKTLVRAGRTGRATIHETDNGLYAIIETRSEEGLVNGAVSLASVRARFKPRMFQSMPTIRRELQRCGITRYDVKLKDYSNE